MRINSAFTFFVNFGKDASLAYDKELIVSKKDDQVKLVQARNPPSLFEYDYSVILFAW